MNTPSRIYHYHIRKTAGSSLDSAFLGLGGFDGIGVLESSAHTALIGNGKRFVAHNADLIRSGDYFFATSHYPAWWLNVPANTFTVTILRDPTARLRSYYRYLLWARNNPRARVVEAGHSDLLVESAAIHGGPSYSLRQIYPSNLAFERGAVGAFGPAAFFKRLAPWRREKRFSDFVSRLPPRHLFAQLYMFSQQFDPAEATESVLACSAVCFTESFSQDLKRLGARLHLNLEERHERRSGESIELTRTEQELLRDRLSPEYDMIDRIRAALC